MRRLLRLAAVLALLLTWPWPAQADTLSLAQAHSLLAIHDAAVRWGVSESLLERVAWCESTMQPTAYNPDDNGVPAVGLFQFHWATWLAHADALDRSKGPFNAWAAANVAATMFAQGEGGQWGCLH